jgi:hypothetical protein
MLRGCYSQYQDDNKTKLMLADSCEYGVHDYLDSCKSGFVDPHEENKPDELQSENDCL